MLPVPTPDRRQLWTRLGSRPDAHLHGQFPLPLVGGLQGRWPALSREWGGGAGRAAGLGVLAGGGGQHLGPGPLGGLQLLPEQQVVPGLLHLPRKARGASPLHPRQPTEHHGLAQTWRAQLSRLRLWMASAPTPALQPPPLSSASPPSPSTCRRSRQTHVSGHPLPGGWARALRTLGLGKGPAGQAGLHLPPPMCPRLAGSACCAGSPPAGGSASPAPTGGPG